MSDIDELRRLYEAATPGPWHWSYDELLKKWTLAPGILIADHTDGTPGGDELDVANANLIPVMHAAFPFLLAEAADAARLREENNSLTEWRPTRGTTNGLRSRIVLWPGVRDAVLGHRHPSYHRELQPMTGQRKGDWIQTYTGKQFWPLDPRPEDVDINDIARSLSMQCRYNGHCSRFYSVAEHSVLVARQASPKNRMAALLHDAAEAYLCDLPRPVKHSLSEYAEAEAAVERAIATKFGVPHPWPDEVKYLDNCILHDEKAQLMRPEPAPWRLPGEPLGVRVECWSPERARIEFMSAFHAYCEVFE